MPHLTLEYTDNVSTGSDFNTLFLDLHNILAETGGINIKNCKSRALKLNTYLVAAGKEQSFIHLEVAFLSGRSTKIKEKIGNQLLKKLQHYFVPHQPKANMQITVELRDLPKQSYFKYSQEN